MNKLKLTLISFIFLLSTAFALHKFYIGVFQIDYFKEKKSIQITTRLFIDDFEKVLPIYFNQHFYITTNDKVEEANTYIEKYLQEKLKIKVNNKIQNFSFLLKEQ